MVDLVLVEYILRESFLYFVVRLGFYKVVFFLLDKNGV